MHIKKNIHDIILGTILNIKGKTNGKMKSHLDLQAAQIRPIRHPVQRGNKPELPPASYALSENQIEVLHKFLKE